MIGYKGFDKDFKCNGFQYEIGKEYVHDGEVKLCKSGFHFCENPHDVLGYYPAGDGSHFAIVEADEVSDERESDSKRVAKRLKIKSEISVFEICRIAVDVFFENFGFKKKIELAETNSAGAYGAARAGAYGAARAGAYGAARAGDNGAARAGDNGAASAGDYGAARAGDYGAARAGAYGAARAGAYGAARAGAYGAARAGDNGAASAGYNGAASAGDNGAASAGYNGAASAGDYGAAEVDRFGVAVVSTSGKVKGKRGSILVARNIEWNPDKGENEVSDWACALVDGETIKEDTWYVLKNGKLVEEGI